MKKLLLGLTILFSSLCLAGAGYVLYTQGTANPGYAVIPFVLSLCAAQGLRALRRRENR